MSHTNYDLLLCIEEATAGSAVSAIGHLASCAECHATLAQLDALASLRTTVQPDPGFDARVAASLRRAHATEASTARVQLLTKRQRLRPDWHAVATFAFASMTVLLLLLVSAWTGGVVEARSMSLGSSLPFALLAGAGLTWHMLRSSRPMLGR